MHCNSAAARRENYEERRRLAAIHSPAAVSGDDGREAAIAAAKEKEAAWLNKQQQAYSAVGAEKPQGGGGGAPEQFEVLEGGQQDAWGTETAPEPAPAGYVEPEAVSYAGDSFDDYDTIVPNEVEEDPEVQAQHEASDDQMRDLLEGVLVDNAGGGTTEPTTHRSALSLTRNRALRCRGRIDRGRRDRVGAGGSRRRWGSRTRDADRRAAERAASHTRPRGSRQRLSTAASDGRG